MKCYAITDSQSVVWCQGKGKQPITHTDTTTTDHDTNKPSIRPRHVGCWCRCLSWIKTINLKKVNQIRFHIVCRSFTHCGVDSLKHTHTHTPRFMFACITPVWILLMKTKDLSHKLGNSFIRWEVGKERHLINLSLCSGLCISKKKCSILFLKLKVLAL